MATPTASSRSPARPVVTAAAVILLALFWWLATSASREWSQTSDELPHLTGGYAYDRFGDYRMHSENGNLPQRVHGLVPLALGAKFPMDPAMWRNSDYWQLGWDFLYGVGNPTDRMLYGARALNALFGVALGAFIFAVARRWHGDAGGLLALGFYVLCPNFLAHSALATSDLAGTLCLTLAAWFFWRHLKRRTVASGLLAGLMSGLALVAKFNGVLVAPIYALLIIADPFLRAPAGRRATRLGGNLLFGTGQAAAGIFIIWAFFSFRFAINSPQAPELVKLVWSWPQMLALIGTKAALVQFAADHHLLPYGWIFGLTNVLAGEAARPAFLAGEYRLQGWREFFPLMFLTKTTLALLLALLAAGGLALLRWSKAPAPECLASLSRSLPLLLTAAMVFLTAVTSHLNIGHRHILAVYPVLFIAVGGLAAAGTRWLAVGLVLLAGQGVESFSIRPHYLAFFNPLAGGPAQAYRLVVDSSLDWGQDLPGLSAWLTQNRQPGEKVYLSYFGSAWPPHYGVRPTYFLPGVNIAAPPPVRYDYEAGLYCVSATMLSEVYTDYAGAWRPRWETRFRDAGTPREEFEQLRFARLCKYLQHRTPDAHAGYSILIYRLKPADLRAALEGPVTGW